VGSGKGDDPVTADDDNLSSRPEPHPPPPRIRPFKVQSFRLQPFNLYELLVVIVIVGILVAVAIERLWAYLEVAEKTAVAQTVGYLRSALNLQFAYLVVRGRGSSGAEALARQNPMDWLSTKPDNYLGEFSGTLPANVPAGIWYFDTRSRELVYIVKFKNHFRSAGGSGRVRLRVRLSSSPANDGSIDGIVIEPVEWYEWQPA
jgi:type II secretory pathway pseudopilin PulG